MVATIRHTIVRLCLFANIVNLLHMLYFCKFLHHLHIDKFLYVYSVLHLVNHLCILETVTVPECCLEEFHFLL